MTRADLVVKECEFLSGTIARLSSHGQATKKLAITVCLAAMGLGWQQRLPSLHLLAVLAGSLFWWLDGLFLATERRFCRRYQQLAAALAANSSDPDVKDPLSLRAPEELCSACAVAQAMFAPSVVVFYLALVGAAVWAWRTGIPVTQTNFQK